MEEYKNKTYVKEHDIKNTKLKILVLFNYHIVHYVHFKSTQRSITDLHFPLDKFINRKKKSDWLFQKLYFGRLEDMKRGGNHERKS